MARPLRSEIPIYLAAIAPKAVEQAFEIADGWLPIFWSPEQARNVFPLDRAREGFDIAPSVPALLIDDVQAARDVLKEYYSFYIGGMGARGKNFYNDLFARYGYEAEAKEIQELFLDGKQREAAAEVPDAFVDEVALIGPVERIRDRLAAWRESGATTLLVSTRDAATLRAVAEPPARTRQRADRLERGLREQRHADLEASRRACLRLRARRGCSGRRSPRRRRPPSRARAPRTSASGSTSRPLRSRSARRARAREGKPGSRRHRRRAERARAAAGLAVGREQVADVRARVADRAHLPVEHREDPRRLVAARPSCSRAGSRRGRPSTASGSGRCAVSQRPTSLDLGSSRVWLISQSCVNRRTWRSR